MANILTTPSSQLVADVSGDSPNAVTIPDLQMSIQPGGAREVTATINVATSADVTVAFNIHFRLLFNDEGFADTDIWGGQKKDKSSPTAGSL